MRLSLLAAAALVTADPVSAGSFGWGGEFTLYSDFSTNEFFSNEGRRYFPPSASATVQLRWGAPGRTEIVAGIGYDQRIRTDHVTFTLGPTDSFEFLGQVRERSVVLPLALEVPFGAWTIAPGIEWRHVGGFVARIKSVRITIDGQVTESAAEPWRSYDPSVPDRWSASIAIARVWRGDAGSRSMGLRWIHGLTDVQGDPDLEEFRRSLQLVFGWSH